LAASISDGSLDCPSSPFTASLTRSVNCLIAVSFRLNSSLPTFLPMSALRAIWLPASMDDLVIVDVCVMVASFVQPHNATKVSPAITN
jgi:hypothetical protein